MKTAEQCAEEATENCGEYAHLCQKWFLKGWDACCERDAKLAAQEELACHLRATTVDPDKENVAGWKMSAATARMIVNAIRTDSPNEHTRCPAGDAAGVNGLMLATPNQPKIHASDEHAGPVRAGEDSGVTGAVRNVPPALTQDADVRETDHCAFQQAWLDIPSQDNEGYIPDRGGFKSGWFAALRWERARAQDDYRPHHCKHGTRGVYCFDFHPSHEREKCDAARTVAHAELKVPTQNERDLEGKAKQ